MERGPEMLPTGEKCGIIAVYAPGSESAAHLVYSGLHKLQHRGQEGAGIGTLTDGEIVVIEGPGLVRDVFRGGVLGGYADTDFATGHVRYSTTGNNDWSGQPVYNDSGGGFTLGHNGNIVNVRELEQIFGVPVSEHPSDSHQLTDILGNVAQEHGLAGALERVLPRVVGAYSLTIQTPDGIMGIRDPHGFRPLVLGQRGEDGGYVLASEHCALDITEAKFLRDINPGEIIAIDRHGVSSSRLPVVAPQESLCAFEYVYFSGPDNLLHGQYVHEVRKDAGRLLAAQSSVDADVVVPLPNSGRSAAIGYAEVSGIPIDEAFKKSDTVGRTFIAPPGPGQRERKVREKFSVIKPVVDGKKVAVVDDSIVRGTTTRVIVKMLKEAGAKEVHFRISSSPYRWPCFYGMDTAKRSELIAARLTPAEIREYIGADTLDYLSYGNMLRSLGAAATKVCTACMDGKYPTELTVDLTESQTPADEVYDQLQPC